MQQIETNNVVQKIWNLCNILRGDGITYYQYVSELTYLLFLKIAEENGSEELLPDHYRWSDLYERDEVGLLGFYQEMLTHLGATAENEVVKAIYAFPTTMFSHSENLKAVVEGIGQIEWHQVGKDRFGDIYSGLIAKSMDARSGAGQYFTPSVLVEAIVALVQPKFGEVIQDPAVGSGGFLIEADSFIRNSISVKQYKKSPPKYQGVEIEKSTRRICLMNTFLHGLDAEIIFGDALTDDAKALVPADVILANPPFGAKAGSQRALRTDIPYPSSNKQLAFLQHIYLGLKEGGRAAVVLPDNILFEDGIGKIIRKELLKCCNLHTILRLPTGIFLGAGVKTNVLFFTKLAIEAKGTEAIWFYDMRTDAPKFGKKTPLTSEHFEEFKQCFGRNPHGQSQRKNSRENGRFKRFSIKEIEKFDFNLDITWVRSSSGDLDDELTELSDISDAILDHLRAALSEIESVAQELAENVEVKK